MVPLLVWPSSASSASSRGSQPALGVLHRQSFSSLISLLCKYYPASTFTAEAGSTEPTPMLAPSQTKQALDCLFVVCWFVGSLVGAFVGFFVCLAGWFLLQRSVTPIDRTADVGPSTWSGAAHVRPNERA